ncbi:MAG: hypothetical protein QS2022_5220 [Candidatus Phytoplasma asteris]|uniref:Uncharacterized protein n=2 Tax=16SrI (Aster yellows group) TaxID=3042590 RepID=A0ABQ0J2L2_9MOLU|nr:hypothetical protein ['Chrysanthemum coronarium' phytoplasma]TKA87839.1 MAG: hypothetical protein PLY_5210 [Periwinkle leaf yellowing phytoplasma]WEX19764.1 MAG: hypothetical protein QS2022_5220 [Candidatus Phytoplasma asteris]GAK73853.1 putative uncharacterized protein ['Chrysanthemum coronarium' phytoplasma]GLH60824.1 hypothetical protein PAWBP_5620 [Paulownia witches'-broom phytoplasma]
MTDSNFTIGFVSGALFVTGLCFVFKYLFFSFLQLFNPNDTYPIKRKTKENETSKPINQKNIKDLKKDIDEKFSNQQEYKENTPLETLINQENN